jgi:Protein of unknown function (DUF4058)
MVSPFPGMNPYLEQPAYWSSFHFRLIGAIAAAIEPQLNKNYYLEVETRIYQSQDRHELLIGIPDGAILARQGVAKPEVESQTATALISAPERVVLPMAQTVQERYLEIREIGNDAVVTVLEVLSPKNERAGEGRNAYEAKRRKILESHTHLVEIDLLRAGKSMPATSVAKISRPYRIVVSRSEQRPEADLYAVGLQQPLPTIPVPLKAGDADLLLALQTLIAQIYEEARYEMRIDYTQPFPAPMLSAVDQQWIETLGLQRRSIEPAIEHQDE